MKNQKKFLARYSRWTFFSIIVGILAGLSSTVFLVALDLATNARMENINLIWFLPLGGFVVGWIYHQYGKEVSKGNNLIIDEIHNPQKIVPLRMAPLVLFGTIITHLFGGSAGREGTAVQMGASLADQLTNFFKIEDSERKILLVAGMGAGFGSAIGTPIAGAIFGMEVLNVGRLRLFALFECFISSYVAFYLSHLLKAPHSIYPLIEIPEISFISLLIVGLAGIIFGLTSILFVRATHLIEKIQSVIRYSPLRPLLGGIVLVVLFHLEGTYRFSGLGIEEIKKALLAPSTLEEPLWKIILTALTVGSGFKGGEFIPLVFIGTTLGSFLSQFFPVSHGVLGAIGFASVFAGASNTPIACSLMAIELFGVEIAPFAIVGCFMSYYFSGHHGIYKSQKIHRAKHKKIIVALSWLGELPKRFLNSKEQGK